IDFIDMVESRHREEVFAALERELLKDHARHKVLALSEFGLVELTRERARNNLERQLTTVCPYCDGGGRIASPATVSLRIRRAVLRLAGSTGDRELMVRVHPDVARALRDRERGILAELERELGGRILLQEDAGFHRTSFDILEV